MESKIDSLGVPKKSDSFKRINGRVEMCNEGDCRTCNLPENHGDDKCLGPMSSLRGKIDACLKNSEEKGDTSTKEKFEGVDSEEFLNTFFAGAIDAVEKWLGELGQVSIELKRAEVEAGANIVDDEDTKNDLQNSIEVLEKILSLLKEYDSFWSANPLFKEDSVNFLSDFRNKLCALHVCTSINLPEFEGDKSVYSELGIFVNDILKDVSSAAGANGHLAKLSDAFYYAINKYCTWKEAVNWSKNIARKGPGGNKLELSYPGMRICVVDDEEGICKMVKRSVERAGGRPFEVSSSFKKLPAFLVSNHIHVVLLDHNLGEGIKGHDLVDPCRMASSNILIVGHSSEAKLLNRDKDSPYKKAHVRVADKADFKAISKAISEAYPRL